MDDQRMAAFMHTMAYGTSDNGRAPAHAVFSSTICFGACCVCPCICVCFVQKQRQVCYNFTLLMYVVMCHLVNTAWTSVSRFLVRLSDCFSIASVVRRVRCTVPWATLSTTLCGQCAASTHISSMRTPTYVMPFSHASAGACVIVVTCVHFLWEWSLCVCRLDKRRGMSG